MSVVVMDTAGRPLQTILRERAVIASPSWTPDGRSVVFTSDHSGRAEVYRTRVDTTQAVATGSATPSVSPVMLVGSGGAELSYPAVSPDGARLAVTELRGDGYHIGVAPFDSASGYPLDSAAAEVPNPVVPPLARDSGRITRYSPWVGLIPRYWMPVANTSDQGYIQVGAYTSAYDVLQRHNYSLQALYDFHEPSQIELDATYEYRGLGYPVLDAVGQEYWTHQPVANAAGQTVGELVHRTVTASAEETLLWPRARTNTSWSVGADIEARTYSTDPGPLITRNRSVLFIASLLPVGVHDHRLVECGESRPRDLAGRRRDAVRDVTAAVAAGGVRDDGAERRGGGRRLSRAESLSGICARRPGGAVRGGARERRRDLDIHGGRPQRAGGAGRARRDGRG